MTGALALHQSRTDRLLQNLSTVSMLFVYGKAMTPEETIRANAQLVIDRISERHTPIGYNRESVEWLDGFIERARSTANASSDGIEKLVEVLGSYLGECVIHTYGGTWKEREDEWGVFFDDSNAVFPFNKVRKQFKNGGEDSILSFFEIIPEVFKKL